MLRLALASSTAAILMAASSAQTQPATSQPSKVPTPAKYAGTFHVATGTWTRSASSVAAFGQADNIYSNTAASGYFDAAMGPLGLGALGRSIDDGAVPGTTNPTIFTNGGAVVDVYDVGEIQLAYCDLDPAAGVAGWTIDFYEDYAPCTALTVVPVGTVVLSGLPSNGCWVLDVDLTSSTGTGENFAFQADGGAAAPGFDNDVALDSFGVSWRYTGTGIADAGPLTAGNPATTDTGWTAGLPSTGSNTYYGELGGCPGTGTGYGNGDQVWREDTFNAGLPGGTGCYFFGGYANGGGACGSSPSVPMAGFWLEMSAAPQPPSCICASGCLGAVTSTGSPAICEVYGDLAASANNAELRASGMPPNQFGIFATGREGVPPMIVNAGNGWLCINPATAGGLGRFQGANQVKSSGATGTFSLDTSLGEWSLTSVPTSMGTYAVMSGTATHFQAWFRDTVGSGFNFSGSTIVIWQ